jgi:hypothetical protein
LPRPSLEELTNQFLQCSSDTAPSLKYDTLIDFALKLGSLKSSIPEHYEISEVCNFVNARFQKQHL